MQHKRKQRSSIFVYPALDFSVMSGKVVLDLFKQIFGEVQKPQKQPGEINKEIYYARLLRLLHLLGPIITAFLFYYYFKYFLTFNACRYENYVKQRKGYMRNVSRQLKNLSKRYGNFYFCYMPMNHGTSLPQPYTLFMAIKELLINSNKPATRVLRTNLLVDLLHSDHSASEENASVAEATKRDYMSMSCNELETLSELNLGLMNCSRELIIQGVKDFDVMSTVYHVIETIVEDGD